VSEVTLRDRLIGAGELVNFVERDMATNEEEWPWRQHPLGLMLYTHDGYVSAQLQRRGRGAFVSDDPSNMRLPVVPASPIQDVYSLMKPVNRSAMRRR
jgi:hypothetical protein